MKLPLPEELTAFLQRAGYEVEITLVHVDEQAPIRSREAVTYTVLGLIAGWAHDNVAGKEKH